MIFGSLFLIYLLIIKTIVLFKLKNSSNHSRRVPFYPVSLPSRQTTADNLADASRSPSSHTPPSHTSPYPIALADCVITPLPPSATLMLTCSTTDSCTVHHHRQSITLHHRILSPSAARRASPNQKSLSLPLYLTLIAKPILDPNWRQ